MKYVSYRVSNIKYVFYSLDEFVAEWAKVEPAALEILDEFDLSTFDGILSAIETGVNHVDPMIGLVIVRNALKLETVQELSNKDRFSLYTSGVWSRVNDRFEAALNDVVTWKNPSKWKSLLGIEAPDSIELE